MKVAFDVMGTLEGRDSKKVLKLFGWFEKQGCKMFVWSSLFSYAVDAVTDLKLNAEYMGKREKFGMFGADEADFMDVAVEDDVRQFSYLAAHNFINVNDIPEDESEFDNKFGHLISHKREII